MLSGKTKPEFSYNLPFKYVLNVLITIDIHGQPRTRHFRLRDRQCPLKNFVVHYLFFIWADAMVSEIGIDRCVFFFHFRARFESLSSQLFQNCLNPVQQLLEKCNVEAVDVEKVVQ